MTIRKKTYNIISPAKINIGLRVQSKRKDGYHNIETIFYPIKLCDDIRISISPADKTTITVGVSGKEKGLNLNNKNNICYKTASLFLERYDINGHYKIKIFIKKNIPVGGGLGGGSSNAASVLKVLSKHFRKSKQRLKLQKLALELGSDVPFFLLNKPAYATGRGEKLKPLPKFKAGYKILIVNPGIHVSTAWAFEQLRIKNYKLRIDKSLSKIKTFNNCQANIFVNDFEKIVFKKYRGIEILKQKMYDIGAIFASMSGSGSTIYGFFTPQKIKAAKKYFSSFGFNIYFS